MELTNELTVIISMFAMVISMFAILAGFIVAVWRGQATLIQRIDERLQAHREETRANRKEDREEARANRKEDREELRAFRAEVRANRKEDREEARANREEDREDFREFRTETRNSFNLTNQNIEKIAEQVGSHAERVATVEGYISAVSDR